DRQIDDSCYRISEQISLMKYVIDDVGVQKDARQNGLKRRRDDISDSDSRRADKNDLILQNVAADAAVHHIDHGDDLMNFPRTVVVHLKTAELVCGYEILADLHLRNPVAIEVHDRRRSVKIAPQDLQIQ